jgi:class 3 adenylate cyclase
MAVRYARNGDQHLAYRVFGEGAVDLLHHSSLFLSFDSYDDEPHVARFERRLGAFARVIEFDTRGIGLSDRADVDDYNVETFAADALAVLDAAGSTSAILFCPTGAGFMGITLAARHPERVQSLILVGSYARLLRSPEYPIGLPPEVVDSFIVDNTNPDTEWRSGEDDDVSLMAPSLGRDLRFRQWFARESKRAAGPTAARRRLRMEVESDVTASLSEVNVPTLVIHRSGDKFIPVEHSRYLAEHIRGARFVELPGDDHLWFAGDADGLLDEIEEFVTGRRSGSADRVLATLLFTDIVDSTKHASEIGDTAWRAELDAHDTLVRSQLARFGGREVNTTGDGFVAMFDGPTSAIACAQSLVAAAGAVGIAVRLGLHTGECERRGDDVAGLAVHIAARVAAVGGAGDVVVSRTFVDLLAGSDLRFRSLGEYDLKGVARPWELFALEP